jgi:hypothetical protein
MEISIIRLISFMREFLTRLTMDLESCQINVYESHRYQSARAVWIFDQVIPSLVLKTVSVMR